MISVAEQTPVTFLFTDIEGSTRLWEQEPDRMPPVMARHDAISRAAVERHHGTIVKMTGDGVHAAFDRPLDALIATLEIQQQLSAPETADGLALPLRCGLHAGIDERRDGDFYGRAVNRAARIMCAAHGGQMLVVEGGGRTGQRRSCPKAYRCATWAPCGYETCPVRSTSTNCCTHNCAPISGAAFAGRRRRTI